MRIFLALCVAATAAAEPMRYAGDVKIDPASGVIEAEFQIDLPRAGDNVAFLLSSAFVIDAIDGPDVRAYDSEVMAPGAAWDRVTVQLKSGRESPRTQLRFAYSGSPTMPENGINQISPDWIELSVDSAWHPIIETLDQQLVVDLRVNAPGGEQWSFVGSGNAQRTPGGWRYTNDVLQADIAFVLAQDLSHTHKNGFTVFHRSENPNDIETVLSAAVACREYLDAHYGAKRRLPDGAFVVPDRETGGYARKNFIALTRIAGRNEVQLTEFLCHELAHFWSSGAEPLTVENWLNESFAVFMAALAVREMFGVESFTKLVEDWRNRSREQGSIWTIGNQKRRSYEVNYKKGPLALNRLMQRIGHNAMGRLLVEYANRPVNTTPDLLEALEYVTDPGVRRWFTAVLGESDE